MADSETRRSTGKSKHHLGKEATPRPMSQSKGDLNQASFQNWPHCSIPKSQDAVNALADKQNDGRREQARRAGLGASRTKRSREEQQDARRLLRALSLRDVNQ
jgi:hypothetical protein